jgi:hypothetical protein
MPTKDNESQRKLFGAALAAKRGNKPISKKVADIAASTSEKELSKMASKNEGADVGQEFDNQVGDYYAVQRPYDGCEPGKLVHKVNPLQGVQGIGVEPVQIYGAYTEEKMAMTMAEKLHKDFTNKAMMLEKKKAEVIERIKETIDELEAQRSENIALIKENPKESGAHKDKIAHLATKIDDLMTKLEKIESSKKEIEKKEDKKQNKNKK